MRILRRLRSKYIHGAISFRVVPETLMAVCCAPERTIELAGWRDEYVVESSK